MIDRHKLHKIIKVMFKETTDINNLVIFGCYEKGKWKIFYNTHPKNKLIPNESVSLWLEYKKGYMAHSPSLATDLIYEKLKKENKK